MQIGVIGSSQCSPEIAGMAEKVGEEIAKAGAALVCGGLGGVMSAAARGAKRAGGKTIGILPGFSKEEANRYIDVFIVTGLSQARNLIVVRSSDAVVAVEGGFGTLSEIALALNIGVPVIGLNTWELEKAGEKDENRNRKIIRVTTPEEAVRKAIKTAEENIK
ncbi:TIGR00725 family protein [candidate division NPL-UPA2 bacterium]|nr:TIGR00725 family protein [candidate division NPL-UPA2 bacterium]